MQPGYRNSTLNEVIHRLHVRENSQEALVKKSPLSVVASQIQCLRFYILMLIGMRRSYFRELITEVMQVE